MKCRTSGPSREAAPPNRVIPERLSSGFGRPIGEDPTVGKLETGSRHATKRNDCRRRGLFPKSAARSHPRLAPLIEIVFRGALNATPIDRSKYLPIAGQARPFFTLGWVAERHPELIRRIVDAGHELASHGYSHIRVDHQSEDEFRADVSRTRRMLEDISGVAVTGYRAASFSIGHTTPWAHRVLAEEGYQYSSSINPISHDHYGMPDAPRFAFRPAGEDGVVEYPMTTVRLFGRNLPCSGGGFFRLMPYTLFKSAVTPVQSR